MQRSNQPDLCRRRYTLRLYYKIFSIFCQPLFAPFCLRAQHFSRIFPCNSHQKLPLYFCAEKRNKPVSHRLPSPIRKKSTLPRNREGAADAMCFFFACGYFAETFLLSTVSAGISLAAAFFLLAATALRNRMSSNRIPCTV